MRTSTGVHEPPRSSCHSGKANVASDDKVAEEQPSGDEGVFDVAGWLVHDVDVGRIEAEGRCRETVGDEVYPEELDGNESLRETKCSCQEDAVWR